MGIHDGRLAIWGVEGGVISASPYIEELLHTHSITRVFYVRLYVLET